MTGDGDDTDDADGSLGAAWGGGGGDDSGGPPPRPEDVDDVAETPGPSDVEDWDDVAAYEESTEEVDDPDGVEAPVEDRSILDRVTGLLVRNKTAFTLALFAYAFLVFPWLNANGLRPVGIVIGAAFLGGIVLVTVANAHQARDTMGNDDERRGF
jgi:hypothetical protein